MRVVLPAALVFALTACATEQQSEQSMGRVVASIALPSGTVIGRASVREVSGGLKVNVEVQGLPSGRHGIHIHSVGRCDAPDFASAGGHWNPAGKHHGLANPQGPHMGDLPNLIVGSDGRGAISAEIRGGTLGRLLESGSAAMVVHAAPDDEMTDPSGNSGARIACGVFSRG